MKKTLLAVLAHPDDESYGIGGTLARYAHEGVEVHVAIATDGSAGSIDEKWQGDRARLAEARKKELEAATEILGATLHTLGYRDSGYIGDPANQHQEAFINAGGDEAVGRIVRLIRDLKPQVVITHDETGGYFHPDHIRCCDLVTTAFFAAADSTRYAGIGPEPHKADRLYYSAFSNRWVRLVIFLLRLRGRDPKRTGRNQDIDLTQVGVDPAKITATIDFRDYWDLKIRASQEHGSQGGGTSFTRLLPRLLQKRLLARETFIRAYPQPQPGYRESDLFTGL